MEKNPKLINYTLSMGLIILILLFLIAIVQISRYVLEDASPISEHVTSTKALLNDIQEVEKNVEFNHPTLTEQKNLFNLRVQGPLNNNLNRVDSLNMPSGEGIMTLVFDSEIKQFNNIYYLSLKNISDLHIGEVILFKQSGVNQGVVFDISEDNSIEVINYDSKERFELLFEDIVGKVIVEVK